MIMMRLFWNFVKKYDLLNSVVEENVRGIRVVKSYVTEEKEIDKFNSVSKDVYNQTSFLFLFFCALLNVLVKKGQTNIEQIIAAETMHLAYVKKSWNCFY